MIGTFNIGSDEIQYKIYADSAIHFLFLSGHARSHSSHVCFGLVLWQESKHPGPTLLSSVPLCKPIHSLTEILLTGNAMQWPKMKCLCFRKHAFLLSDSDPCEEEKNRQCASHRTSIVTLHSSSFDGCLVCCCHFYYAVCYVSSWLAPAPWPESRVTSALQCDWLSKQEACLLLKNSGHLIGAFQDF